MRVKIVVVDSCQSHAIPTFDPSKATVTKKLISKLPVIRVFGITDEGQKCCVHVHNAFPFLLVPCISETDEFIAAFAESLDALLGGPINSAFVYDVKTISAYPIYGYYGSEQKFYKIFLLNPADVKKASEILLSGKVMGQRFQPHEAHIPYHLQFLVHFNLYGMGWMRLKKARFRQGSWCNGISDEKAFTLGDVRRNSSCAIECDINAVDIENQYDAFGEASVSSLSALWEDERARRVGHGMPVDDLKLPASGDQRNVSCNEREKALLNRLSDAILKIEDSPQNTPGLSEEGLTQVLEGIIEGAEVEMTDLADQSTTGDDDDIPASQADVFVETPSGHNDGLTQVLENIVGDAEFEADRQINNESNEDIEPGSILSFSRVENFGQDCSEEVVDVDAELQDVDWNAFVTEYDIPPQLDGTFDKPCQKPTRPQRGVKRHRTPSVEERPSTSNAKTPDCMIVDDSEQSSRAVVISSASSSSSAMTENFETGCMLGLTDVQQVAENTDTELLDSLALIAPNSPVSDYGSSSIYSFRSSTVLDVSLLPSPSSPTSDSSVKITGFTPSQRTKNNSSRTPNVLDQTSIQFFHDDLITPFPHNDTSVSCQKLVLKPKKKPPSRGQIDRWLRSIRSDKTSNKTTQPEQSFIASSQQTPAFALTSTPHPRRLRTPVVPASRNQASTILFESTITSPIIRNDTPYSFAVKSMKNISPVSDGQNSAFAAQFLTVFSVELHASSTATPDPTRDAISCLILSKMCCLDACSNNTIDTLVFVTKDVLTEGSCLPSCTSMGPLNLVLFDDELSLILHFLDELEENDPDIMCGYEIERASLGYLIKRGMALGLQDVLSRLGRIITTTTTATTVINPFSGNSDVNFSLAKGRVIFAVWRLMRHELEHVQSYAFEATAFHVLHRRMPKFDQGLLSLWLRKNRTRCRTLMYYVERAIANLQLLTRLNLLSRTCELARLYGILYYDVLSRGSQYRVEAVLLRLAKRLNFIAASPSMQQRASQCAPECIPLTLEPISNYYKSPVIVLDFQSLYPSIMIAYNYSFETCLGKLDRLVKGGPQQLGCFSAGYEVLPSVLKGLSPEKDINISPNGVVFVKRHIRRGVLSAIVEDLLNSRLMVKASLKLYKDDPAITKQLDARQLGLKLLANVTYGYTAANFSGRMPCIEVADAIVRKGREALENAIALVTSRRSDFGGAKVIYGDTDSLFVLIPGATVKEAFDLGAKIADAVTKSNPYPMKLKLERVFSRCILEAKKRYCGFSYESADQKEPELLSKGIETIRKDQCGFVASVLEKTVRVLFSTDSKDQVIRCLMKEIKRLESGNVPVPKLLLSREYRGPRGYSEKGSAQAMVIASRRRAANPLTEPLAGDRVHFMVTVDAPGTSITQSIREPMEIVQNGLRPNVDYYIRRQLLPALDRALGTADIDVWRLVALGVQTGPGNVAENHRVAMKTYSRAAAASSAKIITLTQMYTKRQCIICGTMTTANAASRRSRLYFGATGEFDKLCLSCRRQSSTTCQLLSNRAAALEKKVEAASKICHSCCRFQPFLGMHEFLPTADAKTDRRDVFTCSSVDCPIFYDQYNRESLLYAARECRNVLATFDSVHTTL